MTELYFLIPAGIILLLFLPVVLELRITYNVLTNTGVISVYLYKFNLIYYIFEIKHNEISIKDKDNTQEKKLDLNGPEIEFYKNFVKEVMDKLRLRFLDIFYNIGVEDAFLTSMVCGYINAVCLMLFSKIKNSKPTAKLGLYDTAGYNQREVVVVANTNVSISLFDLVYSLILSGILTMKSRNKTLN